MALISAGVEVTITDESFFIPSTAPTVPLIFIATADDKLQPDGVTPAAGTQESDVVRTITSLTQSIETYGVPTFLETSGAQHHGDARNEYGLLALNQYLGIGNRAYVVRANVNSNDDLDSLRNAWDVQMLEAQVVLVNLVNEYIAEENARRNALPGGSPATELITTIDSTTLNALARTATEDVWASYSFSTLSNDFFTDVSSDPLLVYGNGYDAASTGIYNGFDYESSVGTLAGSPAILEYTAAEAGLLLINQADDFRYTLEFYNQTALGANDAERRAAIVTALQSTIVSNTDVRSETFDYNLILCPGYHETVDDMIALSVDIADEALVVADTPMTLDADGISNPSTGWAATTARFRSVNVAYYYPSSLVTNLDGVNVAGAASGTALRTIAYSDDVSFLWFAPAGLRRGLISGVSSLGYVDGTLGGPTTWTELNLNQGQRDALYDGDAGDINPLVFFPGQGFVVWGQKTSAPAASAMDRVNVSRLMKHIKRQLRRNTLSFVFQPNDQLTRDNLKAVVDNFLGDLVVKRGLYDFATVCDESNNTPFRIDNNEMYIDVALKPVKAAEFIYIPIRIVATGAEI